MVFAQTMEEAVLAGVASQKGISQLILSKRTDQERAAVAQMVGDMSNRVLTATVSYVGKADYKGRSATSGTSACGRRAQATASSSRYPP